MKKLQYCIVLLCIVALWGCGKGNPNAPVTIDPVTQKHPVGWAANGAGGTHPDAYFANAASCEECHGKIGTDAFARGGISGVSCSNPPGRSGVACHPSFPHAAGFAAIDKHGSVARDDASGITGMAHCRKCHGSNYTGAGTAPSCIACHQGASPPSNAPHAGNWITGTNGDGIKHGNRVVVTNAPACAQCHLGGTNTPTSHKEHAPPAGLAPDCFNNTLCHGPAGHELPYVDGHKAAAAAGLSGCQACHATLPLGPDSRFNLSKGTGVLNPNGCEGCHINSTSGTRTGLAHPYMWLPGRGTTNSVVNTTSHANAGTINASCAQLCHGVALTGGALAPSCMGTSINGTACHSAKPVDAAGVTVGCGSCHGATPNGTAAPNRAFRHTAHFANTTYNIAGLTCSACHSTYGTGTTTHATKTVFTPMTAPTKIDPKFYESNGVAVTAAAYTPATGLCANVSCHGGKLNIAFGPGTFPAWKSATAFNLTNNCFNCHYQRFGATVSLTEAGYRAAVAAGTKPYIGPFSGNVSPSATLQNLHEGHYFLIGGTAPTLCLKCHPDPGTAHFSHVMDGRRDLPRGFAAVGGAGTSIASYNSNTGSCLTGSLIAGECHDTAARIWH